MTQKVFEKCKKHFKIKEITEIRLYEMWNSGYKKYLSNGIKVVEITDDTITIEYGKYTGKRKYDLDLVHIFGKCEIATVPIFTRSLITLHRKDIDYIFFVC